MLTAIFVFSITPRSSNQVLQVRAPCLPACLLVGDRALHGDRSHDASRIHGASFIQPWMAFLLPTQWEFGMGFIAPFFASDVTFCPTPHPMTVRRWLLPAPRQPSQGPDHTGCQVHSTLAMRTRWSDDGWTCSRSRTFIVPSSPTFKAIVCSASAACRSGCNCQFNFGRYGTPGPQLSSAGIPVVRSTLSWGTRVQRTPQSNHSPSQLRELSTLRHRTRAQSESKTQLAGGGGKRP